MKTVKRLPQTIFFPGQLVPLWVIDSDIRFKFTDIVLIEEDGQGVLNVIRLGNKKLSLLKYADPTKRKGKLKSRTNVKFIDKYAKNGR